MENKYYTPTIEEFHVGFEFENFIPKSNATEEECWKKLKMTSNFKLEDIYFEIIEKEIRVKHLDREDIESLGWKFKEIEKEMLSDRPIFEFKTYLLSFNRNEHGIWILIIDEDSDYQHFSGKIKNKSELKRLMQQLNILVDEKS